MEVFLADRRIPLALSLLLAACAPPQYKIDGQNKVESERAAIAPYIGHEYYILVGGLMVHESPNLLSDQHLIRGSYATIDDFNGQLYGKSWMHVAFRDGQAGFVQFEIPDLRAWFADKPPPPPIAPAGVYPSFLDSLKPKEAAERRRLPGVTLGMQKALVLSSAWGEPTHKKMVQTLQYSREKWFYPGGEFLIFQYNRVIEISR
jgi:hypothetical protein